jgi:ubiquinone/menaquinone biosynthesis C-methylase UbiE
MPRYIRALSFKWLTAFYDPLLRWTLPEEHLKRRLIERARIQPGQRVLDLGCGTGTLTLMLKRAVPDAIITGLDGDQEILDIARSKAASEALEITWDRGLAYNLPYPAASFDVVISSLVTHHLDHMPKERSFQEVNRVLRPSGWFHILDFGRPFSLLTRLQAGVMRNFEETVDNFDGRIVPMLEAAGFSSVAEEEEQNTIFGPLWYFRAQKS